MKSNQRSIMWSWQMKLDIQDIHHLNWNEIFNLFNIITNQMNKLNGQLKWILILRTKIYLNMN